MSRTKYIFRRQYLEPGQSVEIPDNARDIDYTHDGVTTIVSWLEKQKPAIQ